MGVQAPQTTQVSDVTIYNIDMLNLPSLTHIVLKEMQNKENSKTADSKLSVTSFSELVPRLLKTTDCQKNSILNMKRHLMLAKRPQYKCNRKFCHACLRLQYDDDFNMCKNNRSWICHYCYGVCFCTRCLRQDTITQLKAYYIAMGGHMPTVSSCGADNPQGMPG